MLSRFPVLKVARCLRRYAKTQQPTASYADGEQVSRAITGMAAPGSFQGFGPSGFDPAAHDKFMTEYAQGEETARRILQKVSLTV